MRQEMATGDKDAFPIRGSVIELHGETKSNSVQFTSLILMFLSIALSTLPLVDSIGAALAMAPTIAMAMVLVFKTTFMASLKSRDSIQKLMWIFVMLPFFFFVAFCLDGDSDGNFGLLPLAAFSCSILTTLVVLRPTVSRMGMMGGFVAMLLLIHISVRQTLLDSLAAGFISLLVWVSLASRYVPGTSALKDKRWATFVAGLRKTGLVVVVSIPVVVLFFLLFPRLPLNSVSENRPSSSSGSTGLSNSLTLGSITELKKSREPAFVANFKSSSPQDSSLYWRSMVLDKLSGQSWVSSEQTLVPLAKKQQSPKENVTDASLLGGIESSEQKNPTEHTLQLAAQERGVAMPYAEVMDVNNRTQQLAVLDGTEGNLFVSFSNDSMAIGQYTDGTYSLTPTLKSIGKGLVKVHALGGVAYSKPGWSLHRPDNLNDYIQLPANFNPKTQAHGKKLREKWVKPESVIDAVMNTIRTEDFHYTLKPPKLGRQAIDDFFFDERKGFCEHYASTFVVLMRGANIPARLVTGYLSGPVKNGEVSVSQGDAHAWAEVWIDGRGWVRQDPTAFIDPSRVDPDATNARLDSTPSGFLGFLSVTWHKKAAQAELFWKNTMLEFDSNSQSKIFKDMGLDQLGTPLIAAIAVLVMAGLGVAWQYIGDRWIAIFGRSPQKSLSDSLERQCKRIGLLREPGQSWREMLSVSREMMSASDWEEFKALIGEHERITYGSQGPEKQRAFRELSLRIKRFRPRKRTETAGSAPGSLEKKSQF